MFYRIWSLIVKELIQLWRDKLMMLFVLLGPLTELLMVAWSTSQGIDHLPTAVLDLDRTAASRGLITAVANTETFDPYFVETMDQVSDDIGGGRAMAAWVIPAGFQAQLNDAAGDPPQVQVIVDGADVAAAQTAAQVAPGIVARCGGRGWQGAKRPSWRWLASGGARTSWPATSPAAGGSDWRWAAPSSTSQR